MSLNYEERLTSRNPDVLYEIKKLLRSRCSDTKLSAVNVVESCLQNESLGRACPLREFMLEEDMVGFLCDAMATNSWPLLLRLTNVLELLSDSDRMLLEGHAVVAVEAAQRRAHFLGLMISSSSTECEAALRAILGLVSTLLRRWRSLLGPTQAASNLCPPQGLLSTARLVLDARCTSPSTKLSAAHMLCALLHLVSIGREPGDATELAVSVASCVRAASTSLLALLELEGEQDDGLHGLEEEERTTVVEEACHSLCEIIALVTCARPAGEKLRGADSMESEGGDDDALLAMERLKVEVQQTLVDKVLPMVVKAARTCLESSEDDKQEEFCLSQEETRQAHMTPMISALLYSLKTVLEFGRDAAALADTLACQDFLWLLPTLHRTQRSDLALQLLCSVLAHLAADLLDAAAWWAGSATDLAAFLFSAVPVLPDTDDEWAGVLEEWGYLPLAPLAPLAPLHVAAASATPRVAAQLFVLLHTYFRAVVGSDCDPVGQHRPIARSLPAYVLSLPQPPQRTPASVLKMVWVSFAVNCELAADSTTEARRTASARLTQLLGDLEARGALALAFTAHPCLLYWAFQAAGVSPRVQQAVLELWLAQDEAGDEAGVSATTTAPVLEIVLAQRQAVHPLLDVVTSAPRLAADAAANILLRAASTQPTVALDLGAGLWGRLPLSLSRCGRDRDGVQDADGCGLLVWLAAEVCEPPPAEMALRVANLLGGVLGRRRLAVPRHLTAAMHVLGKLLDDSRIRSDPRVHATLLSDARFAQALLSAAGDADVQVRATALQLLRHLEKDNALLKSPVVQAAQPLSVGALLLAVCSRDLQVVQAGVELLLEVLQPKPHPFLALEDDDEVMRSLYFTLQNQALKVRGSPAVKDAVWRTLAGLLARSPALCHQPWNHVLITFSLKQAPLDELGDEVIAFVLEWLRLLAPSEPPEPTPRRPMPTMLTETAMEIATALVESDPGFPNDVFRDIADAILRVTANLPPNLMSRMKKFAGK